MSEDDLLRLRAQTGIAPWRLRLAGFVESVPVQRFILAAIIINAIVLGLYIDPTILPGLDPVWFAIDLFCLGVFAVEITLKLLAYRLSFFKSGWNVFDFLVVGIALVPGNGSLSVLRTLRVLRVLRLLTVVPSLRRVVAAFIHSIPGLGAVVMVMAIFFYAAAVMAVALSRPCGTAQTVSGIELHDGTPSIMPGSSCVLIPYAMRTTTTDAKIRNPKMYLVCVFIAPSLVSQ